MIRRAMWELKDKFIVCYVHRNDKGEVVKCVPGHRIVYSDSWAIYLDDDTTLPYHRVIEIRDISGRVLWSRRGGEWNKK